MSRKRSGKSGLIRKAAHPSDFGNGETVIFKESLSCRDPSVTQIIIE